MALNRRLYVPGDGVAKRLLKELLSTLLVCLMLFQLAYPWGVGVSRFRDNRHNASDVVAGFLLGLTFAAFFLVRAIGQHEWWSVHYDGGDADGGDGKDNLGVSSGAGGNGAGAASLGQVVNGEA